MRAFILMDLMMILQTIRTFPNFFEGLRRQVSLYNFLIDSATKKNVLSKPNWEKLKKQSVCILQQQVSSKNLFSYGINTHLRVIGKFKAAIRAGENSCYAKFHVIENNGLALLGRKTALWLKVFRLDLNINAVSPNVISIVRKVFQSIGKFEKCPSKTAY